MGGGRRGGAVAFAGGVTPARGLRAILALTGTGALTAAPIAFPSIPGVAAAATVAIVTPIMVIIRGGRGGRGGPRGGRRRYPQTAATAATTPTPTPTPALATTPARDTRPRSNSLIRIPRLSDGARILAGP